MSHTSADAAGGVSPMTASHLPGITHHAPPPPGRGTAVVRSRGRQRSSQPRGSQQRGNHRGAGTQLRGSHQTPVPLSTTRGSPPFQPPQATRGETTETGLLLASTRKIESHCSTIIQQQKKMLTQLRELKEMMEKIQKKGFAIKGSQYELPLRKEVAKLFCTTLSRYPATEQLQRTIRKVLPREEIERNYVIEACLKECSSLLSSFRTEERRRVLGGKPLESLCHMPTEELAKNIMSYMKAPSDEEVADAYTKHLALLRSYIRTNPACVAQKNFHVGYKNWVNATYPAEVTNEQWEEIMAEDAAHPYDTNPLSYSAPLDLPGDGNEVPSLSPSPSPVNPEQYQFEEM